MLTFFSSPIFDFSLQWKYSFSLKCFFAFISKQIATFSYAIKEHRESIIETVVSATFPPLKLV